MLSYRVGDIFDNLTNNPYLVVVAPATIDGEGVGIAAKLRSRYPESDRKFKFATRILGDLVVLPVADCTLVYMIAQNGYKVLPSTQLIIYSYLSEAMVKVSRLPDINKRGISTIKFGTFHAGGDWSVIEKMIDLHWTSIPVTICVLE